jgi:phage-related protein
LVADVERVPEKFLKKLRGTKRLYEIRVRTSRAALRIFRFFDDEAELILLKAFKKKSAKIPSAELGLAQELRNRCLVESPRRE